MLGDVGIESLDPNDLLLFDQTYPERISLRRSLLREYPKDIIGVTDDSNARIRLAVQELYRYLFQSYLPCRYPSQFRLCGESGKYLVENLVTHEKILTEIDASIALREALETMAENIDEDFFILLPHRPKESKSSHESYVLEAYAACFPSGFQPGEKIGKKLADIHEPVPGYREKLERSMDRFFARLEVGRPVKRVNWSLTVDEELYSNFDKGGTALKTKPDKLALEDLDLQKVSVQVYTFHSISHTSIRHLCAVSDRLYIVCQSPGPSFSLSIPTCTLFKTSRQRGMEKISLLRLMGYRVRKFLASSPIRTERNGQTRSGNSSGADGPYHWTHS